jgi:hypothetical protein
MKTILCSLLLAIAGSASGLAQTITANLAGSSPCVFPASSVTYDLARLISVGVTGISAGPVSDQTVILQKTAGVCSRGMAVAAFLGEVYPTMTITVTTTGSGLSKPRTITLSQVRVSSISTDWSNISAASPVPVETVQFKYSAIVTTP